MDIRTVGIVGSGFMGSGIAQVCAQAGYTVKLVDQKPERTAFAMKSIAWSVGKLCEKGAVGDSPETILGRIAAGTDLNAVLDCDLLIEAVFENIGLKLKLFAELDARCESKTVFASNTSTIPITKLANATHRPDRFIGMHFFGPVPLMRLVEITPNPETIQEVIGTALDFARSLGKSPILVNKDIPGFLMNRIFGAMACEAIRLVEDGAGTITAIDQGMCDGFNMHVGPLCIADLAGLDIALNAFNVMYELDPTRNPAPPDLLKKMVSEGKLGAKTGEGFYHWAENGKRLGPAF